jgi:gliding motility-associatede transport system auxiliary component
MQQTLRRMNRGTLTVIGVALAVLCFLAVNLFSTLQLGAARLDLTENGLYTLSDSTSAMLKGMKEPVKLRLYASRLLLDSNPAIKPYAARVREVLASYVKLSGDRISLEIIDPEPFSPEEDRAAAFGLRGVPYDPTGNRGYFGLVGTNTTDDTDSIPFLAPDREPFLEYDLTRLVYNLAHPAKPVVAVLDGLGINGGPQSNYRPWQIYEQMRQFFDLRIMAGDIDKFGDDVKALVIIHPHDLSDKTQFAIDQFVLRGGPTMVFVDPLAENMQRNAQMGAPPPNVASNLEQLMRAWGIALSPGKVVGDRRTAMQVQAMSNGRAVITQYLPWLAIGKDSIDRNDVVTGQLELLRLFSAGALVRLPGATTKLEPLVESTPDSMLIDAQQLQMMPDPAGLMNAFKPSGLYYPLAARISGPAKSAFPDGAPAPAKAADADGASANTATTTATTAPAAPPLKESSQPINLVVVADVDMLSDEAWLNVQDNGDAQMAMPIAHNADLVINAIENLAGGAALANLRGRGLSNRPFTTFDRIRTEAEAKYLATEEELSKELEAAQKKLATLEVDPKAGASAAVLLTAEQQETVRTFRAQVLTLRAQLREVQHALQQDIDRLQTWVMLANIAAVPALVALLALIVALWRRARRHRTRAAAAV